MIVKTMRGCGPASTVFVVSLWVVVDAQATALPASPGN